MISLLVSLAVCGQITSYVDAEGTTHYVDSPSQIPAKYRKKAKPLEAELSTVAPSEPTRAETDARMKKLLEEQDRAGPPGKAATARKPEPKPDQPVLTAQQKERQKYDAAVKDLKLECSGPRCVVRPTSSTPALKPGESCRSAGASCTVPPECCSHRCNSTTFTCE